MKRQTYSLAQVFIFTLLIGVQPHSAQATDNLSPIEQLGQLLYFDQDLSFDKNQSCASCHTPPSFSDPANSADPVNNVVSLGSDRKLNGGRNAPTASYAALTPIFRWDTASAEYIGGQFWDGRAATLSEQAKGPFLNPVEMAMPSMQAVLQRIAATSNNNAAEYSNLFATVYNVDISVLQNTDDPIVINGLYNNVADAIAAFESTHTFSAFSSKFDYSRTNMGVLSQQEMQGMMLFNGRARCSTCHSSRSLAAPDGSLLPAVFSDFSYSNIGVPKSNNPLIANNSVDYGLGGRKDIAENDPAGLQLGKFKVSTLRNVEITAPYGHNGFFATLEDIVHFYNTRDTDPNWPGPEVSENMETQSVGNLGLSANQEASIVAFLKTLTDGFDPATTTNTAHH